MVIAHKKGRWIEELGIKEKDFHVIECDENYLLLRIPDSTLFEIDRLTRDRILAEIKPTKRNREILRKHDPKIILKIEKELKKILLSEEGEMPKRKGREKIDTIALNVSALCNLRCSYCFAEYGSFGRDGGMMDREKARKIIRFFTAGLGKKDNFHIHFFGGEPLINFKLIEEIVLYTKEIKRKKGISFSYSVVTNGTLFENRIVRFLRRNGFRVSISIDGLKRFHDSKRVYPDGKGSYLDVCRGLKLIESMGGIKDLCARVTVSHHGFDFVKAYESLIQMGFARIHFTPRVTYSRGKIKPSNWQVMRRGMKELFEYSLSLLGRGEVTLGRISNFNYIADRIQKGRRVLHPCKAGRSYLGVDIRGEFSPCNSFTGIKRYNVGSISRGLKDFKLPSSVDGNRLCKSCWARYVCGGGCYFENFCQSGNLEKQIKSYCDYTKALISWAVMLYIRGRDVSSNEKPSGIYKEKRVLKEKK